MKLKKMQNIKKKDLRVCNLSICSRKRSEVKCTHRYRLEILQHANRVLSE